MEAQLLAEIVSGVAGLLGIIVGVIFLIRIKKRRKDWTRSFSEWKPMGRKKATIDIQASSYAEKPFPVSVAQVLTQTTLPEMPSYPTPKSSKIAKLKLDRYKLESEAKIENVYKYVALPNLKRGTSLGSIQSDLYGEEHTSTDSSNEDHSTGLASPNVDEFDDACGGNTPDSLPEQWSTPTYATTVEFTVTYVNSSNALAIHVRRLINLPNWKPFKSSNSHRIKMKLIEFNDPNSPLSLEPEPAKKLSTIKRWGSHSAIPPGATSNRSVKCVIKKTFDIAKGAFFAFSGYSLNDLKNLSLFIYLYELKYKNLREKVIGECKCALSQLELIPGTSVTCMEEVKLKKKNDSSKEKTRGQLLLSLYYQTDANRMKVLIRKATDLPKKKLLSIGAEYGVLVNVIYCGQILSTQETKKIHSRTPVWNQPFIFDIPEKNLEKYSLQFITFCSGGVSQPHHFIGHVVIGPDVRGSGHDHWMEATHPKSVESTCWHKLQHLQ